MRHEKEYRHDHDHKHATRHHGHRGYRHKYGRYILAVCIFAILGSLSAYAYAGTDRQSATASTTGLPFGCGVTTLSATTGAFVATTTVPITKVKAATATTIIPGAMTVTTAPAGATTDSLALVIPGTTSPVPRFEVFTFGGRGETTDTIRFATTNNEND